MTRYSIYVGLNDPITHKQIFSTEKYISILKNVCKNYKVCFSFAVIQGGYIYESGDYSDETTLYISLFDMNKETVNEIAKDICTFFNQESIMITEGDVKMYYLHGDSEVREAGHKLKSGSEENESDVE